MDVMGRGKAQAYDDFFIELFSSLAEFFLCGLVDGSGSFKHHLKLNCKDEDTKFEQGLISYMAKGHYQILPSIWVLAVGARK